MVAVAAVLLPMMVLVVWQRLERGPVSLDPAAPWVEASIEERLGRPVSIHNLRLRLSDDDPAGLVLDARPVVIGGDRPVRAETLLLRFGLPIRLQELRLHVVDTDAPVLLAAWPTWLLPEVRATLGDLIQRGTIETGDLRYRFDAAGNELGLQIDAKDVTVDLPNGLPSVASPAAQVTIENDVLHVTAPTATAAGMSARSVDVTVHPVVADTPSRLRLKTTIDGQVRTLDKFLTTPPLAVLPADLIDPSSLVGNITGDLTLGLPLIASPQIDAIDLDVKGRFTNLAADMRLPVPLDLIKANGRFSIDAGAILIDGKGELAGAPVVITLHDRWRGQQGGRRIEISGPVDKALIERFGASFPDFVDGTAMVSATITQPAPDRWNGSVDADLANLKIEEPMSGFTKPVGMPGKVGLTGNVGSAGSWQIGQFELTAGSQAVAGSARPTEAGISIKVDRIVTQQTDLAADLVVALDGGIQGRINGQRARLPSETAPAAPAAKEAAPPTPLALELSIDDVATQGPPVKALRGHVRRDSRGFSDVDLTFDLNGTGSLRISPSDADRRRLDLRAADAGALVTALGAGKSIAGGKLKIEAEVARQVPVVAAKGRLDLEGAAVATGDQKPIEFEKVVIPFAIDGPEISIDNARLTGPSIGIRVSGSLDRATRALKMSGEVTPLYRLNRLVGQVPILGTILGGSKGLGAINAPFTLTGTLDDPKAKLSTASVLVPGVIRDLLGAVRTR